MFEQALRRKLRFEYRGLISTEDLWDLSLENLDTIYRNLSRKLRESKEGSLLVEETATDEVLRLKVDIIKRIVEVRLVERKAREDEANRASRKGRLLEIIADKQDEELKGKSVDELTALVNSL